MTVTYTLAVVSVLFAFVGLVIGLLAGAWAPFVGCTITLAVFVPFAAWLETQ